MTQKEIKFQIQFEKVQDVLTIVCVDGMALMRFKNSRLTQTLKNIDVGGRYMERSQTWVSYFPNQTKEQIAEYVKKQVDSATKK